MGRIYGDMPFNAVRSLLESINYDDVKEHIRSVELFRDVKIEHYDFPEEYPLYFRRIKAFDPIYIYGLKNINVSPFSGLCWTKEGKILVESIGSIQRIMGWGGNLIEVSKVSMLNTNEEIIAFPDTGYFHWLLEILPSFIYVINKIPNIKILCPPGLNNYQNDFLSIMFKNNVEERIIKSNKPLCIENYIMPAIEPYSGFVVKEYIQILRETFLPLIVNDHKKTKIYISRRKSKKRKMPNEEILENELRGLGFEILYFENIPLLEQVKIVHSAGIIVAPHGAGLANIVFAEKDTKVIEIFPNWLYNDCFARLAINNNLIYNSVRCELGGNDSGKIPINELKNLIMNNEE